MRLVRLRKHFSQGNPIKISRGLHTCPLNRLWFRVLHTDPINMLTMNTSASLRWSSQFNIRVVVVGIGHWHTRTNKDLWKRSPSTNQTPRSRQLENYNARGVRFGFNQSMLCRILANYRKPKISWCQFCEPPESILFIQTRRIHLGDCWAGPFNVETTRNPFGWLM